jgi:osmotically-inducible protein OsmY
MAMSDRWRRLVLVLAVALALGACATFDPLEDTRIEAEVKARLVGEKNANLTRVGVVSSEGVVHLTGTVASPEQRARAETLAGGVSGVRRVVNQLDVKTSR